jgi:outer membrane protein assembly factor BamE (lipoprotein component of BamABCDE complex)
MAQQYEQIHVGMSRDEVCKLLGKPHTWYSFNARGGDTEVWINRLHGQANRLSVSFDLDGQANQVKHETVVLK